MHYIIGDVHGCYDELMALLAAIEKKDKNAQYIFVGDFIDRGPQVDKVLAWCMENITSDGRYRSVRGNHEQMVLDWYYREWLLWWEAGGFTHPEHIRMPETRYDFSKWMDAMDKLSPEKLQPYMDFFDSLPYHKALEIESVWGKKVIFRIVHSFYESEEVSEEVQKHSNLWKRIEYGNLGSEEILVHGHTPTLNIDYIYWGVKDTKPGMVSYRRNDINVDGGCVFAKSFPMYPAMLCAIRLEDLEEIYAYTVEERFLQGVEGATEEEYQRQRVQRYTEDYLQQESKYRKQMLKKLGHPTYLNISEEEAEHVAGEPRYSEGQQVVFRHNNEERTGTIDIVNPFGIMGDREQPYYDILVEEQGIFVLYKWIAETDVVEVL